MAGLYVSEYSVRNYISVKNPSDIVNPCSGTEIGAFIFTGSKQNIISK